MVGGRSQHQRLAVEFDLDPRLPHCIAQGIAGFVQTEKFDARLGSVGQLDFLRFVTSRSTARTMVVRAGAGSAAFNDDRSKQNRVARLSRTVERRDGKIIGSF